MAQPVQTPTGSTRWLVVRIVALAALWVAVNLWLTTHFGKSLTEIGTVNAGLAAAAVILGLLPEHQQQSLGRDKSKFLQRLVQRLLSPPLVGALILAFVAAGSLVSTVRFERSGVAGDRAVELLADGRTLRAAALTGDVQELRFLTWTLPFAGRDLLARVSGFGDESLVLEPWRPARVPLNTLSPEPGVFLRVALNDLSVLAEGSLRFACRDGDELRLAASLPTRAGQALVALGSAVEPEPQQVERWIRDALAPLSADAKTLTRITESARQVWSSAQQGPDLPCFAPGRNVYALLCTSRHRPWAAAEFTVQPGLASETLGGEALQMDAASNLCENEDRGSQR